MMTPETFARLQSLRMENDEARYGQQEIKTRFDRLAGRHVNGTAPRAVSAFNLFQTPVEVAAQLAELLNPHKGARILEPSVGLGRLLDALKPYEPAEVVAVEIEPQCTAELCRQQRDGVIIMTADFLELSPADLGFFDFVIMNPPFCRGLDIKHILHACNFLKDGGTLAAICANGPQQNEILRLMSETFEKLPPRSFASENTSVDANILTIKCNR